MSNPSESLRGRQEYYAEIDSPDNVRAGVEIIMHSAGRTVSPRGISHASGNIVDNGLRQLQGIEAQQAILLASGS
jgi:hypothetical protein